MHETPDELASLQDVLDHSYEVAGPHLRSIHTKERRLTATELVDLLRGVCILDLATVSGQAPFVAPVDGLFLGGRFWFGSAPDSLRFRHIRANPRVSAAYTLGESVSVVVHGRAREIDTADGSHEHLHEYCREVYGYAFDTWGYWGKYPYARIEPERLFAIRLEPRDGQTTAP